MQFLRVSRRKRIPGRSSALSNSIASRFPIALILSACFPICALYSQSPSVPREEPGFRAELRGFLEGSRYKPASPAQFAQIRRSNANVSPGAFAGANDATKAFDSDLLNPRAPLSRTDQLQAVGLALFAGGGRNLFYDLSALLLMQQGESRFARGAGQPQGAEESDALRNPETLAALPGDQMRLGLRFCEGLCEFSLGRRAAGPFLDGLSGGHGALTGAHLYFESPKYGSVYIAPLYRPELSGTYFRAPPRPDATSPEAFELSATDVPGHSGAVPRLRDDFTTVARKSRSYGQRIVGVGRFAALHVSVDYANHRQSDTANPAETQQQSPGFRRSVDYIHYTGVGLGYRGQKLELRLNYQRSTGAYRTLLPAPAPAQQQGEDAADAEPTVERRGSIAGGALFAALALQHGAFRLRADFFLPEPAAAREPGAPAGGGASGYIGFGDTPLTSPILAGNLDFRPAPRLCHERGLCEGLAIRNFAADRAALSGSDDDVLEYAFRDHAAVFALRFAFDLDFDSDFIFGRFTPDLGLTILAPLAPRPRGGRTPFEKIKKDPHSFEYREIEAGGAWRLPDEGEIGLRYSRLYRRHRAAGTNLAGESLRLEFRYQF